MSVAAVLDSIRSCAARPARQRRGSAVAAGSSRSSRRRTPPRPCSTRPCPTVRPHSRRWTATRSGSTRARWHWPASPAIRPIRRTAGSSGIRAPASRAEHCARARWTWCTKCSPSEPRRSCPRASSKRSGKRTGSASPRCSRRTDGRGGAADLRGRGPGRQAHVAGRGRLPMPAKERWTASSPGARPARPVRNSARAPDRR